MAFRGLSILAATLVAALSSPSLAGETKLGAPNLDGDVLQSAATAACDESALPGKPGGGQIKRYKLTFLGSFTEFDPKTCKPHGPGSWTVTDQDRCDGKVCGKVTTGVIRNRPLASGECPGKTYDFGAICYTWTKRWNGQVDDTLQTVYVPPRVAPVSRTFKVKVPVVYPDKEKTEFAGWRPDGYGKWQATLTKTSDPSFDWSLNGVRESDPGFADPAADTCWCEGSIYDQFYKISGGDWDVTESGLWRFDNIGYGKEITAYYRKKRRAPCGTKFRQQMQFEATPVSSDWVDYGPVNTLVAAMTHSTITSGRAGQSKTQTFKPVPKKSRLDCGSFRPRVAAASPASFGARLVAEGARPVAEAVRQIQEISGQPIAYEDPPLGDPAAMAPMVVSRQGPDPELMAPKAGRFAFDGPADRSREAAIATVKAALAAYAAQDPAARFVLREDAGLLQVVPLGARDATGRVVAATSALDLPIAMERKPRTALEALDEILERLSAALGRPVGRGAAPLAALAGRKVALSTEGEPAREVLARLVAATGMRLSWRLLYDPGLREYALNLAEVAPR